MLFAGASCTPYYSIGHPCLSIYLRSIYFPIKPRMLGEELIRPFLYQYKGCARISRLLSLEKPKLQHMATQ